MNLKHNETQFFSTFDFKKAGDIKQALVEINQKLDNLTRQVSFWDVYNVTQIILKDSDIEYKLPLLNVGESAIVNVNYVNANSQAHYRGDIAYKTLDGNIVWIPAENKGTYKPSITWNDEDENIEVKYEYTTGSENPPVTSFKVGSRVAYSIDEEYDSEHHIPLNSISFDALETSPETETSPAEFLKPIIRFFIVDINSPNRAEDFNFDWYWNFNTVKNTTKVEIHINTSIFTGSFFNNYKILLRVR